MKIRYSTKNDQKSSKMIWKDIFKDSPAFIDFYFDFLHAPENLLIAFKGENYAGSLYENPYLLRLNGVEDNTKYMVAVAVYPEYRGEGIMRSLLDFSLFENFHGKIPTLFLSPIDPNLYRRFGFEYTFDLEEYSFPVEELRNFKKFDILKRVTLDDIEEESHALKAIYDTAMKRVTNYLERDAAYYIRHMRELESEEGYLYLVLREGRAIGYISFYLEESTIRIREILFKDKKTLSTLFFLIGSYVNYYETVEVITPPDTHLEVYLPNEKKIMKRAKPFLMGRILDIEKTLNDYIDFKKFPKEINFSIRIHDPIILENSSTWSFRDGRVMREEREAADMEMEIGALTQLIYGYFSLEEMIGLEKVKILCHDTVMPILGYFSKSRNYILEYV